MTKTWYVFGRLCGEIIDQIIYEKVYPKTQKVGKFINGTCSVRNRNISKCFLTK